MEGQSWMSKLNQIQNKILELDGGAFQKLADSYLYKKGYEAITSRGSVSGADKVRKGTPDAFFHLPNGKYAFAEHTTQREGVFEKLQGDIEKCFDETKTGILLSKIERVLLCHTSKLSPEEESTLAEKCQQHGVDLEMFGIDRISQDLYQKYRGLARDPLGIEVDTGQIVPPDEFVVQYNKNKLTTRLNTVFHFRGEELKQILQGLDATDIVLVSGRAGVGKTRLTLEGCRRFQEAHPEYQVRCILNRGRDLFEDLRVDFSEPGHFLIFVDDANRIGRFEYVVDLLQRQREDQRIKVIATVRDYALGGIQKASEPYGGTIEVEVRPLEDKEIRQLVQDEYNIHYHLYLDRIVDIAQGNPRLAVMAAEVARQKETLQSIHDVSALYDRYFESIREDLEGLGDAGLLQAAGIVAFFRVVDRSNGEVMEAIENAFGLAAEDFWAAVRQLHEMEVFDLYDDEVVRTSDQVLATYLFYLAFFRQRVLDFSVLLERFFPQLRNRLMDAVNPILNTFGFDAVRELLLPHVQHAWKARREAGDATGLLHLLDAFGFVIPTDTLLYLQEQIQAMEMKPVQPTDLKFEPISSFPPVSIGNIFGSMQWEESTLGIALDLLYDYAIKRPEDLPRVLYLLVVEFGILHTYELLEFWPQTMVIDTLWERAQKGDQELFSRMFLAVAKRYLRTDFETSRRKGMAVEFLRFSVVPSPELSRLRGAIWSRALSLFQVSSLRGEVLGLLREYSTSSQVSVDEVVAEDSAKVLLFISSELDPDCSGHRSIVQKYLACLRKHQISFPLELMDRFRTESDILAESLKNQWPNEEDPGLDFNEHERRRRDRLTERFKDSALADYLIFFERCAEILATPDQDPGDLSQIGSSIEIVLSALAQRNPDLYAEVLGRYLDAGNPLALSPQALVAKLIENYGPGRAYEILNSRTYPGKRSWLFSYHRSLPPEAITKEHLEQLYALYREAEKADFPYHLDFLLKYRVIDHEVVAKTTAIALEKVKVDGCTIDLSMLFNPYTEINKALADLFSTRIDLLGRAYLANLRGGHRTDSGGRDLSQILDLDPSFFITYLDEIYLIGTEQPSREVFSRDYSYLWMRDGYEQQMTLAVEGMGKQERKQAVFATGLLKSLFNARDQVGATGEVRERQDRFLHELIRNRHGDRTLMDLLFSVIARFPQERSRPFVARFLENNKSLEAFERLPLTPRSWGPSGSSVTVYQRWVDYFESLLPLFNAVNLLQHRQLMERRVQELRAWIEVEKKRDFMKD